MICKMEIYPRGKKKFTVGKERISKSDSAKTSLNKKGQLGNVDVVPGAGILEKDLEITSV